MATVFRSPKVKIKKKGAAEKLPKEKLELELSDQVSEPSEDLWQYSMLLYGEKKIGKTSLCSELPGAQFLATEPGYKAQRIHANWCPTWQHVIGYTKLLEEDDAKTKPSWKYVVVDIIDKAYDLCFEHMCKKMVISHPHDEQDFGKSWGIIKKEFAGWLSRLLAMNKGVVLISHAKLQTARKRDGSEFDMIAPSLTGQPMDVIMGLVDTIAYCGYSGSDRVLTIRGDDFVVAGTRCEDNFLTKIKRNPINSIDMGSSKKQSYANLVAAFENKTGVVGEVPTIAQRPKKKR